MKFLIILSICVFAFAETLDEKCYREFQDMMLSEKTKDYINAKDNYEFCINGFDSNISKN
jgi:hypothetical protein